MAQEWTAANAAELRSFFNSESGRMTLGKLLAASPKIKGTTVEQVAMEGSRVAGYQQCLENLEKLYRSGKPEGESSPFVSAEE